MDAYTYGVALVSIEADDETPVYLTNRQEGFVLDGHDYISSPDMDLKLPRHTGDLSAEDGHIEAIRVLPGVLSNIAGGYPYNQITVTVREVVLDDSLLEVSSATHFSGLVYQAETSVGKGSLGLVLKDWKYYLDVVAGMPCSENCTAPRFGDAKICQKAVAEYPVIINTINGHDATVDSVPVVADFLFNKGYFKYKGTSILIKFWDSGVIFQTSDPVPNDWIGEAVTLVAGCDKTLTTCRLIHNNEARFGGWGIAMVDYNPQGERY